MLMNGHYRAEMGEESGREREKRGEESEAKWALREPS